MTFDESAQAHGFGSTAFNCSELVGQSALISCGCFEDFFKKSLKRWTTLQHLSNTA